jgi:hypothetical protein
LSLQTSAVKQRLGGKVMSNGGGVLIWEGMNKECQKSLKRMRKVDLKKFYDEKITLIFNHRSAFRVAKNELSGTSDQDQITICTADKHDVDHLWLTALETYKVR